jgi:hypothetical protein
LEDEEVGGREEGRGVGVDVEAEGARSWRRLKGGRSADLTA